MTPEFLDADEVIEIHATQLVVYGGGSGLRDRGAFGVRRRPATSFVRGRIRAGLLAAAPLFIDAPRVPAASIKTFS